MNLEKLTPFFSLFGDAVPQICSVNFAQYNTIPKSMGLYAIFQTERCVYVGEGNITERIKHHSNKAYENWHSSSGKRNSTTDTVGWRDLRSQEWFNPSEWTIEYFTENSCINRTAYEGIMMKLFNPYANNESFADRLCVK